ncbi:unnamed protein product [Closterium sp. NIES-64]|nr:unnamed protein product [Closterium sp. NIES-64]
MPLQSGIFGGQPSLASAPFDPSLDSSDVTFGNATSVFNLTAIRLHNRPAFFLAQTVIKATLSPASPLHPLATTVIDAASPLLDGILRQYLHNDFFAGSLWLVALGFISRTLMTYLQVLWSYVIRRENVTISISPASQAFQWVEEWLDSHKELKPSEYSLQINWNDDDGANSSPPEKPELRFMPKLKAAQHITFRGSKVFFQTKNSPGQLDSEAEFSELIRSMNQEELVIEAPSKAVLQAVLQAATDAAMAKRQEEKLTAIQRWNCRQFCWRWSANKQVRPMSSVVLDCDTSALLEDAREFLAGAKWYAERGIPHRRGYLFHGPPGCGKTSLIQAMAGELGLGVAVISLASSGMSDDSLHTALTNCDQCNLVVLEDIDAAFTAARSKADGSCADSLSFSGLLNALDGIAAQERRILVMTTNHIDRLDPALIRPGRIDFRLLLDRASSAQIARLFLRFFPNSPASDADGFAVLFRERAVSPAAVQGFLLLHKDNSAAALAAAPAFAKESGASASDSPAVALSADAAAGDEAAASSADVNAIDAGISNSSSSMTGSPGRLTDNPSAESPMSINGADYIADGDEARMGWIAVEEASEGGSEIGEGIVFCNIRSLAHVTRALSTIALPSICRPHFQPSLPSIRLPLFRSSPSLPRVALLVSLPFARPLSSARCSTFHASPSHPNVALVTVPSARRPPFRPSPSLSHVAHPSAHRPPFRPPLSLPPVAHPSVRRSPFRRSPTIPSVALPSARRLPFVSSPFLPLVPSQSPSSSLPIALAIPPVSLPMVHTCHPSLLSPIPFPASPHPLPCFHPSPSLLPPIPFPAFPHPLPCFPPSPSLLPPIPFPAPPIPFPISPHPLPSSPHPLPCFPPSPSLLPPIPFPAFPNPLPCFPPTLALLSPNPFSASPNPVPCFPPSPSLLPPILFPASPHPIPSFPPSPSLLPPIPFPAFPNPLPCFPPTLALLSPNPFSASPHPVPCFPPSPSLLSPIPFTGSPFLPVPCLRVWRKVYVAWSMLEERLDVIITDNAILWQVNPLPSLGECQLTPHRRQM